MAYTPQQWHDDTTTAPYGPINGDRLNYIEAGIEAAAAVADAAGGGGGAGIGTAIPLMDGTASAGVGTVSSAVDHVHPTDTSRAALAAPTFTGVPAAPTAAVDTNTTQLATTAYVIGQAYAKLASPTFSGTPSLPTGATATTQSPGDSSTKLATTAFVTTADNLKANLTSPTFAGTPSLPTATVAVTQSASDNSTKLATTAYTDTADALKANLASPTFTGTPSLPTGTTATTQTATVSNTTVATTAYVMAKERAFVLGKAGAIGATETDASDFFFTVPFDCTLLRMKAVTRTAVSGAMTVQLRTQAAPILTSITWGNVSGFVCTYVPATSTFVASIDPANVNAAEGDLLGFSCATGSGTDLLVEVVAVLR